MKTMFLRKKGNQYLKGRAERELHAQSGEKRRGRSDAEVGEEGAAEEAVRQGKVSSRRRHKGERTHGKPAAMQDLNRSFPARMDAVTEGYPCWR